MPAELEGVAIPLAGLVYWNAYHTLAKRRTMGGGMVPIPHGLAYSEISQYARDHGMDVDELEEVVGAMDTVALTHMMERSGKVATEAEETATGRTRRRRPEREDAGNE